MNILSINHLAVIASNLEVSKCFYVDILGFKVIHRIDRPERKSSIIYLEAGSVIIELFSFPKTPKRLSYPEACGLRHVALEVEDIYAIIQELNNKGVKYEPIRIDPRIKKKVTFISDPDGLPIELFEK